MDFQRSSGVLLHISSLPSYGGIGDFGPAAHEFLEFLAAAKQHVWQVLAIVSDRLWEFAICGFVGVCG